MTGTESGKDAAPRCANCGARVDGRFCSCCGQRVLPGLPTVSHLVEEAAEMLSHADSRLWRTIIPLVTRPGFLTTQYISGHRANFLPPLRLYLVLSVVFFLAMGLSPSGRHSVVRLQLSEEPELAAKASVVTDAEGCASIQVDMPGKDWLEPRLRKACARALEDGGSHLANEMLHNLGRAMFIFLPVIAGLMSLLYLRPRRLYVEHLLLLVHNHAATFLLLSVAHLLEIGLPWGGVATTVGILVGAYLLYYNYRALRVVYGEGRGITLLKFALLATVYWTGAAVMLVAVAMMSVLAG